MDGRGPGNFCSWDPLNISNLWIARHGGRNLTNLLYADGHVGTFTSCFQNDTLAPRMWHKAGI